MATIHEQLDELLAADLHDELTATERDEFHAHLVECAECRKAFQEGKNMNRILNETMGEKKADPAFEQRMVSRFRDRVPRRSGFISLITDLMRVRAVQLTAVAAILLALAQTGKMITGESATPKLRHETSMAMQEYRSDQDKPGANRVDGVLSKTDGRTNGADLFQQTTTAPPAPPPNEFPKPVDVSRQLPSSLASVRTKKAETRNEKAPASSADTTTESESVVQESAGVTPAPEPA